jgi:hypothetical protein
MPAMAKSNRWMKAPSMVITIDRNIKGQFVVETPMRGKFTTEQKQTALEAIAEWMDFHSGILEEIEKQGGIPGAENL